MESEETVIGTAFVSPLVLEKDDQHAVFVLEVVMNLEAKMLALEVQMSQLEKIKNVLPPDVPMARYRAMFDRKCKHACTLAAYSFPVADNPSKRRKRH